MARVANQTRLEPNSLKRQRRDSIPTEEEEDEINIDIIKSTYVMVAKPQYEVVTP